MITSISFSHTVFNCLPLKVSYINSIPSNKILNLSKFKAFADDKIIVTQKLKHVLERLENIVGKEQMLVASIFSSSNNVFRSFQKLSFPEVLNIVLYLVKQGLYSTECTLYYKTNSLPYPDKKELAGLMNVTQNMKYVLSVFSSTGRRPASLCHGPLSVVRPSVRPCVNFFFKHLLL